MTDAQTFNGIDRLERSDDWGVYKTLLESTKAIPWKINWQTKQFDYIGPQIERLLGWPRDSWLGAMDWIERIHEEDRERTANFCISQSEQGVDHEADYRALKADGSYVWIRDVVHVIRDASGATTDLVGFMFDITERKQMEERVIQLNHKLEALSKQDELTGVANRRLFEQTMAAEWARARRSGQPLSLMMFDVDYFKNYNDHYGHVRGDDCLQRIARAISAMPVRSSDLFARYGGEEFTLVLPETPADAALQIAEKCRQLVVDLQLPHAMSPTGIVSISVGLCTMVPDITGDHVAMIERADEKLYRAKRNGRNCVCA
ncbi:MAG: sensor domain-containing diguanylate cyclase [Proteobacteria bacterium]|nr:sensor domain-containing diguanylate cyclase [Pseudomonadota bacterium]